MVVVSATATGLSLVNPSIPVDISTSVFRRLSRSHTLPRARVVIRPTSMSNPGSGQLAGGAVIAEGSPG
jgi:hypothetical protein